MGIKIWSAYEHINVSTTAEIMDKLSKHEIDCFVSVENPVWEESDISPLQVLERQKSIFAINPKLRYQRSTDSAMRRIKDDNPFYTDDLYRRYLSAQSTPFFQKKKVSDQAACAIRIGYLNQMEVSAV